MKRVVIMRGLPGSGKSWYAKNIADAYRQEGEKVLIVSADDFFQKQMTSQTGEGYTIYEFNPFKLPEAHQDCFRRFLEALQKGVNIVIVDNTNIHRWEYASYSEATALAGYELSIIEYRAETIDDVKVCIRRNTHKVPAEYIAKMAIEFEPCDGATVRAIQA